MTKWIAWVGGMFGLVASLWTGYNRLDATYARAEDVKQKVGELQHLYLRSEQRSLERDRFQIDTLKEQRKLTPLEKQRLEEIKETLDQLKQEMRTPR